MKKDNKNNVNTSRQQLPAPEVDQEPQPVIRRENYCKFEQVELRLKHHLDVETPIKEAVKDLGISQATFYKYKNLLSLKYQTLYRTPEELKFLEKRGHIETPFAQRKQIAPSDQTVVLAAEGGASESQNKTTSNNKSQ